MDSNAVLEATKEDLSHLGLVEKGHVICLKSFAMKNCKTYAQDDRKEVLAETIKRCTAERTTKKMKLSRSNSKLIQIGWKHAITGSEYAQVKKQSGGGTREIKFALSTTLHKIKEEATKPFFPGGKSKKFGYFHSITASLGDFSGDVIENLDLTIDNYTQSIKMSGRTRLYLLTKSKYNIKDIIKNHQSILSPNSSDDDFEIPRNDYGTPLQVISFVFFYKLRVCIAEYDSPIIIV